MSDETGRGIYRLTVIHRNGIAMNGLIMSISRIFFGISSTEIATDIQISIVFFFLSFLLDTFDWGLGARFVHLASHENLYEYTYIQNHRQHRYHGAPSRTTECGNPSSA